MVQLFSPIIVARSPQPADTMTARRPADARVQGDPQGARRRLEPSMSCVLPCRNEASSLAVLLPRLLDDVDDVSVLKRAGIGRVFEEAKQRPLFIVKRELGKSIGSTRA
jgi:hypothetical protein